MNIFSVSLICSNCNKSLRGDIIFHEVREIVELQVKPCRYCVGDAHQQAKKLLENALENVNKVKFIKELTNGNN